MRVYWLDEELTSPELEEVEAAMGCPIELVRVPHVLPQTNPQLTEASFAADQAVAANALKAARIERDYGARCLLVIPADMRWYHAFLGAIHRVTGFWPYAIQTQAHIDRLGVDATFRIIDMQAALG